MGNHFQNFKYSLLSFLFLNILLSCSNIKSNEAVQEIDSLQEVTDSVPVEVKKASLETYSDVVEFMNNSDSASNYKNGIIPDIAKDNLDYAIKLLNNEYNRFIIVDKATMNVILYNKYGEVEKKYKMACAKNYGNKHKKADSRTPEGLFSVEGKYDSTDWLFTDDNGYTSPAKGQFGPRFIRIKIPTTSQIGIHGTASPWSIGGRVSHGCIRLTNDNILELIDLVEVGMPVIINPGSKDLATNIREGYNSKSITTLPGVPKAEAASINLDYNFRKGSVKPATDLDSVDNEDKPVKTESNSQTSPADTTKSAL